MEVRRHTPRAPLCEFIDVLWDAEGAPQTHERERLLPTGTLELIVDLRDDGADPLISGAWSGHFEIDTSAQDLVMGVHFRPGGAFPFLGVPADELNDLHVPLDTLWGRAADDLRSRLLGATTAAARFRILEHALMDRLDGPPSRHPAVPFAVDQLTAACAVGDIVGRVGLSHRRFVQVFREEVGLTPKVFSRIMRFQQVIRLVHPRREIDWAAVALTCGYYDQAHFINDFRGFSGLTPTEYHRRRSEHMNHVPL